MDQTRASAARTDRLLAEAGVRQAGAVPMEEASQWVRDATTTMDQARQDGTLRLRAHLTSIQPMALLTEDPRRVVCWPCYTEARATRTCSTCGSPAGSASLLGGVESIVRGPAVLYSRVICASCADLGHLVGTFGNGWG